MTGPGSGLGYQEIEPGVLCVVGLHEEAPLPTDLAGGAKAYDELKGGQHH